MKRPSLFIGLAALFLCGLAFAFINPNFTPINLVEQSDAIVLVEFSDVGDDGAATATVVKTLKGKMAASTVKIELLAGAFEAKGQKIMASVRGPHKRALMFFGQFERGEGNDEEEGPTALLHVGKDWVTLSYYEDEETWDMEDIDATLLGTWAGSDVMLRRAVRYILTDETADVPIRSNASWAEKIAAATVPGKVASIQPVDLRGDGSVTLHVASESGDRLLRYNAKTRKMDDVTARLKLTARSRVAAWGDVNADGRVDLISAEGTSIKVLSQKPDGTFAPASEAVAPTMARGCRSLSIIDCGPKRVGVVIGRAGVPVLVVLGAGEGLPKPGPVHTVALTAEAKAVDLSRGICIVADLDNDSRPDILAMGVHASLLYKATAPGKFAAPKVIPIGHGVGRAAAFTGDYDMDGMIDILTVAADGNRIWHNLGDTDIITVAEDGNRIWQNLGGVKFEEMLAMSGEIEYIAKRGGIGGGTGDVNNDGRQDVLIVYEAMSPQIFFNRGFHSFGHARMLDLDIRRSLAAAGDGQQAGCLADVTGDGALDMALVLKNGQVWIFPRKVDPDNESGSSAAVVRLGLNKQTAGPVMATAWVEDRCLGAYPLTAGGAGALFGIPEPGPVKLKWRLPGGTMQTREVFVEDGPVNVNVMAK